MATAGREITTRVCEDHVIVTNGSQVCPSPELCDVGEGETFDEYVYRHAADHQLGVRDGTTGIFLSPLSTFEDTQRNIYLYCFYACHKYCFGNPAMGPFPYWERHAFLVEWSWNPEDLEQGWDKTLRTYRIPPYDQQRLDKITKRFKMNEAPRGTMKTANSRAYIVWRHLGAYFVQGNISYRVLVISATMTLVRDHYFRPLKTFLNVNGNLKRLFGSYESRCPRCRMVTYSPAAQWTECECGAHIRALCTVPPSEDRRRKGGCEECVKVPPRVVRVGLLTKGSVNQDSMQLRWNVNPGEDYSGMAAVSLMAGAVEKELTGQRFDLTVADDMATKKNSRTQEQRAKPKIMLAELMKQLDQSGGQLLINNTRKHLDDMAGDIHKPNGPYFNQFHILHRRASWIDPVTKETVYYWPVDAQGAPRLNEEFLRNEKENSKERDYYAEYQNEPQDPDNALFRSEWFEPIPMHQVPAVIRWGLGEDLTAEQARELANRGISQKRLLFVDPAGQEKQKASGDDTAMVGVQLYEGIVYVLMLRSFKGPGSKEKEQIYQAAVFMKPMLIRYEMPAHSKDVESGFMNWCRQKSAELRDQGQDLEIALPIRFEPISTTVSKQARIESMEHYFRSGRVKIVAGPGCPPEEIIKFREQHTAYGVQDHDDYPDAFSCVGKYIGSAPVAVQHQPEKDNSLTRNDGGTLELNTAALVAEMLTPKKSSGWGMGGGYGS